MAEYPYIIFQNSAATLTKRFRVIAEGYDDGTLDKSVSINKTIGGGIDVSQGAIYQAWNPVIRVKQDEPDTNYGDLADLETFYSYNNPNGSPSDKITFTDHHGTTHTVVIIGEFKKSVLSARIEGSNAHYVVQITLYKVA